MPLHLRREVGGKRHQAAATSSPKQVYASAKAGGGDALDRIEQLLRERFPGTTFKRYHGSVGFLMRHCTAEDADRMAREVQAVVGTTAD